MNYSQQKQKGKSSAVAAIAVKILISVCSAVLLCSGMNLNTDTDTDTENNTDSVHIAEEIAENTGDKGNAEQEVTNTEAEPQEIGFENPTTGVLTSAFGSRWGRQHNGIDVGADLGTEIYAADDGVVSFAGTVNGYGNYIVLDHSDNTQTAYAHCSKLVARSGDCVSRGEVIAYVGSTGNSTGPHLHFEVKVNGEFQDPLDYVIY